MCKRFINLDFCQILILVTLGYRFNFYFFERNTNMNKTIKNTIVFTNEDSVVINESNALPFKEKVMYKIKNSEKNTIIVTNNGETVIP